MTLETHVVAEPEWLKQLLDVVTEAMLPLGFIGPLGYCWWEPGSPSNLGNSWQLAVYPTPNRLTGGGPNDGANYVCGFKLDVLKITAFFEAISAVEWATPVRYNGDLDGPALSVHGRIEDVNVWLRVFSLPPSNEAASFLVNPQTGEAHSI